MYSCSYRYKITDNIKIEFNRVRSTNSKLGLDDCTLIDLSLVRSKKKTLVTANNKSSPWSR